MGNIKVYTTFNKSLGQTAPSAWKCLKTQFWGPLTENLNPLQNPTHTLISSSTNNQYRPKNYVWIYHGMNLTLRYRQNSLSHWKARIWLPVAFPQKFQTHPPKTAEANQFQKGQPTPCKTTYAFPHSPLS